MEEVHRLMEEMAQRESMREKRFQSLIGHTAATKSPAPPERIRKKTKAGKKGSLHSIFFIY
jgi:hypothetical protein